MDDPNEKENNQPKPKRQKLVSSFFQAIHTPQPSSELSYPPLITQVVIDDSEQLDSSPLASSELRTMIPPPSPPTLLPSFNNNIVNVLLTQKTQGRNNFLTNKLVEQAFTHSKVRSTVSFNPTTPEDPSNNNLFGQITSLEFDDSGILLVCGDSKGVVRLYDFDEVGSCDMKARNGGPNCSVDVSPFKILATKKSISCIKWNPQNQNEVVVSYSNYTNCQIFDMALGQSLDLAVSQTDGGNAAICFVPIPKSTSKSKSNKKQLIAGVDNKYPTQVIAGSKSGKIRSWKAPTVEKASYDVHNSCPTKLFWTTKAFPQTCEGVSCMTFLKSGLLLLGGSAGGLISWDVSKLVTKGMGGGAQPGPVQVWDMANFNLGAGFSGGMRMRCLQLEERPSPSSSSSSSSSSVKKKVSSDFVTVCLAGGSILNVNLNENKLVSSTSGKRNKGVGSFVGTGDIWCGINSVDYGMEMVNINDPGKILCEVGGKTCEKRLVVTVDEEGEEGTVWKFDKIPFVVEGHIGGEFVVVGMGLGSDSGGIMGGTKEALKLIKVNHNEK